MFFDIGIIIIIYTCWVPRLIRTENEYYTADVMEHASVLNVTFVKKE